MNAQRRRAVAKVADSLEGALDKSLLTEKRAMLEALRQEEEEYLFNVPDNFQETERYYLAEEALGLIEDAIAALDEALEALEPELVADKVALAEESLREVA